MAHEGRRFRSESPSKVQDSEEGELLKKQKRTVSSQWGINDLPPEAIEFLPKTEENCNNGRTWKVFHHPSQGQKTLPQQRPLHQLERTSFQECWKHPRLPRGLTPPSFCLVSYHLSDCDHWKKGVILEYSGPFPNVEMNEINAYKRGGEDSFCVYTNTYWIFGLNPIFTLNQQMFSNYYHYRVRWPRKLASELRLLG